jgi:hypothetical protein
MVTLQEKASESTPKLNAPFPVQLFESIQLMYTAISLPPGRPSGAAAFIAP